ncbi:unannotated protein [freshwater metagenome]|uniref:Unannotated protein n=1 Tax=freshwater metagenome TaxID=449393 RepID=A0A6J7SNW0_9ZZZZ|nr:hypothetical protein [Actinomycetota bacterium]
MTDRKSANVLLWFALGAGVLTTSFIYTSSLDPFNLPKSVMILGGGIAILFGLLASLKSVEKARMVGVALLLAFLTIYAIAGALGTDNSRRLIFGAFSRATGLMSYFGMVLLAIGVLIATRGQKFVALYIALAAVAGFEVLYGFLQLINADPIKWSNPYNRIIGTLGNPNFMSATLGFSGVAMVALAFNARMKLWVRITAPVLGLCAFLLAVMTDSVQGPIAFAGGLAFVIGVALWQWKQKSIFFYAYSGIAGAVLIVVILGVAKIGPLADKLYQYTLGVRTQYWRAAIKMMGNSPWYGVGVDSYGENYRLVRDAETFKVLSPITVTNAAHSVPLQLGATLGIPLLVVYVLLQLFVAYRIFVSIKNFPDHRIAIAGIAGSWIAFQAQSFISIDQLGVGVWGWILAGSLIGGSYAIAVPDPEKRVRKREVAKSQVGMVASLSAFGLVVGIAVGWQGYVPDLNIRNAFAIPFDQNNQQSVQYRAQALTEAGKAMPGDSTYQALVVSELAKLPGAVDPAVSMAQYVAKTQPQSWDAQNMVAEILENLKRPTEAIPYRAAQIPLDPANWMPMMAYAADLEAVGKKSEAVQVYKTVVAIAPSTAPEYKSANDALARLG